MRLNSVWQMIFPFSNRLSNSSGRRSKLAALFHSGRPTKAENGPVR